MTHASTKSRAIFIAAVLAIALAVLGGVSALTGFFTNPATAFADEETPAPAITTGSGVDIIFDGEMGLAPFTDANSKKTLESQTLPATITLPKEGEEGALKPQDYRDATGATNLWLQGWYVVPNLSQYGDDNKITGSEIKYFQPGAEVTVTQDFVNSAGDVRFYADWAVRNYNFGSAGDTALGGVISNAVENDAITTTVYDINAALYNTQYVGLGRTVEDFGYTIPVDANGSPKIPSIIWKDMESGAYFVQQEAGDHDTSNNAPGILDGQKAEVDGWGSFRWFMDGNQDKPVNTWTKTDGGVVPGLYEIAKNSGMFDENTFGVEKVGTATNGSMFYKVEDGEFAGYYEYNSDEHAAVFNKDEGRFYVYNDPQILQSWDKKDLPAFLPLNNASDTPYDMGNSDGGRINATGRVNYHFATKTDIDFFLTGDAGTAGANQIEINGEEKDMVFYFSGDDDLWVFVDGKLVLDLGGIHGRNEGTINFATGKVNVEAEYTANGPKKNIDYDLNELYGSTLGRGNHKMEVYYVERGANQSNNLTRFLLTLPTTVTVKKLETQTGQPAVFDGATFYLVNKDYVENGDSTNAYYHIDKEDAVAPEVPQVSYGTKENATKLVADKDGVVAMRYLVDGNYMLIETGAPEYYEGLPGAFEFELRNSKIVEDSLKFDADTEYTDPTRAWTEEDWANHVSIDRVSEVTLNVSNDRKVFPFDIKKLGTDGDAVRGVAFTVYEQTRNPETYGGSIDTTAVPGEGDAFRVYEGTTNNSGQVASWAYYPTGAEAAAPQDKLQLKQGAVYYITEAYDGDDYSVYSNPIVLKVTDKEVQLLNGNEFDGNVSIVDGGAVLEVKNPVNPDSPQKKINGKKGGVTLGARDEVFTYTISQHIPAGTQSVEIVDTLEDVLEVVGTPVADQGAAVKVEGQKVTATLADASNAQDKTLTLTIQARIKAGITDADLVAKYGTTLVPNKADVSIDNGAEVITKPTNVVEVTPPPSIDKEVTTSLDPKNSEHGDLAAIDEVYAYTINTSMPAGVKAFKVTDTIDDVLAFDGKAKVTVGGTDMSGCATISGQTLTVSFSEKQAAGNAGKAIVIEFNAKINVSDDELVAKYADRTVPNKASYTITNADGTDQEPVDSNTVTVTPPTPDDGTDGNDPNNNPNNDPNKGSVVVEHRTTDGKVLKPWTDVVRNVDGGTPYTTNPESFDGYRFVEVSKDFDPANGEVEAGTTKQVVYLYEPISDDDNTGGNDPNNNPNRDGDGNGGNNNPNGGNNNPNGGNTTPPARPTTPAGGARTLSQTADAASFATLALGALAVAAFGAGAYSLRRRHKKEQ